MNVYCSARFYFQFPTMDEMTEGEKNFALKVEEFLSSVPKPEYRQLLVEVCCCFCFLLFCGMSKLLNFPGKRDDFFLCKHAKSISLSSGCRAKLAGPTSIRSRKMFKTKSLFSFLSRSALLGQLFNLTLYFFNTLCTPGCIRLWNHCGTWSYVLVVDGDGHDP